VSTAAGSADAPRRLSTRAFAARKGAGERVVMVAAYDALFAALADDAGVDAVLVGDSLGNVVLGYDTTLPVTLEQMIHHGRAARRGTRRALLVVDLPFLTYQVSTERALLNAGRVMQETACDAVKLEGGSPETAATVSALVRAGVPVMGHVGFTPQSVRVLGGARVQAREADDAQRLLDDARRLEDAGAFAVVLELVPSDVAARVTEALGVPTMGYLHEGHLTLVDEARRRADVVAMSVFVNPLQFAPQEDLARYPRDPDGDAEKARERGVDLLFMPDVAELYPHEPRVLVTPGALAERWEGAIRPGHFAGVLTVVAKLFHLLQPDVALFGQKDLQQATLVRAMVRDLDFPLDVVVVPTVREPDGLAMSSRNVYLSREERGQALVLSRALRRVEHAWRMGERQADTLREIGRDELGAQPQVSVDYFSLADLETLEPIFGTCDHGAAVMVAARVGRTRLIDNVILTPNTGHVTRS
jgi:pantoate--beta-alanine ligase